MCLERPARLAASFVTLVAMTLVFAACDSGASGGDGLASARPVLTADVPDFDGPYAAEFSGSYASAKSDLVRGVLQDGQITDAEFAEMAVAFTSCLADQVITFDGFKPDESFTTSVAPNGGDTEAIVDGFSLTSGEASIGALHSFMLRNPENLDWATIVSKCLVHERVVPQDYSAEEFSQDNTVRFVDSGNLPPDLQAALGSCTADPLGILD